ncbi:MAG: hypothetical protein ACE3NC_01000 [Candidatus Wallacebacter cryptica]
MITFASGGSIILAGTDSGTLPLTRYQRVIVDVGED